MKQIFNSLAVSVLVILVISCNPQSRKPAEKVYKKIGSIERLSANLDQVVPPTAVIEILAEGFDWTEGPVWVKSGNYLLFSDIPKNSIFKWTEADSITLYLKPSGYTGTVARGGETGSNGLLIDPQGRLVMCQHGNRQIAYMDAPLDAPEPKFVTRADRFGGKRFNSPNDAVFSKKGDLFFTDPPYGLEKQMEDSSKELNFQGVFRLPAAGKIELLISELARPNGIGLSPDEKTLYVANSDPQKAVWMAYDLGDDGKISNGRTFYDAMEKAKTEQGLPDGLKVHSKGYLFGAGPGGIWIFNPSGTPLGIIHTTVATANCAFNGDESVLYITAGKFLLRVMLK